jgi:hypothetical protein
MTDSFLFNAAAEAAEDESRLAGNPPPALVVDPHGVLENPEGATPVPDVVVQTPAELAPEGSVPELNVRAAVQPNPSIAVIPAEGGVGADALPLAGIAVAAMAMPQGPELAQIAAPSLAAAVDLPEPLPVPTPAPEPQPEPQPQPESQPEPQPEPQPQPAPQPGPEPAPEPLPPIPPAPEPEIPPQPPEPPDPPNPPEPPEPPHPPEPEVIDGRWMIHQTSTHGMGDAVIWEHPDHSHQATTTFDVSFNQGGDFKLEEGQRIEVYLDVLLPEGSDAPSPAQPQDWTHEVTSEPGSGLVVVSSVFDGEQLVVTLEADRPAVNLNGEVFRVDVTAVSDDETEPPEAVVFDINDTVPARDLSSDAPIGTAWDDHDDLLITIEDAIAAPPDGHSKATEPNSVGDLVEAFEQQSAFVDLPSSEMSPELSIPDPSHDHGFGHAFGHDAAGLQAEGLMDEPLPDEPDPLPEDQIEHASDGVGAGLEEHGDLNAAWSRLT